MRSSSAFAASRSALHVGMDSRLQRGHVCSLNRHRYGTSAALPESYDSRLADATSSSLEFFVFVFIALLATDETLVYFDDAAQLVKVIARAARLAQTLQHEPSGLLGNANLFPELQTGDAFACGYEQIHGVEPLVQGNMGPLEDRACTDREIEGTGIAAIEANLRLFPDALTALTLRAERSVRPEPRFQIETRRLRRREHLEKLEGTDCAFAHRGFPLSALSSRSHDAKSRHTSPMCSRPPGVSTSPAASCSRYEAMICWIAAHTLSLALAGGFKGMPDAIARELQGSQYSPGCFPWGQECEVSWPNPSCKIIGIPPIARPFRGMGILRCSDPAVRIGRRAICSLGRHRSNEYTGDTLGSCRDRKLGNRTLGNVRSRSSYVPRPKLDSFTNSQVKHSHPNGDKQTRSGPSERYKPVHMLRVG